MSFFTDLATIYKDNKDLVDLGTQLGSAALAYSGADATADATRDASERAAAMGEFKPYSITSGFGTSYFDKDKQQAGYELDPRLKAFQDAMYGGATDFLGQINTDPTAAAQQYYDQQQGLMAGGRQAEDINLRQQQLQSGRIGLGLSGASQGAGVGTGYVNPDQYQQQLARAQVDRQLATDSTQLAQADIDRAISRGAGLFQTGVGIEELGLKPLQLGMDIGNRAATLGANQGSTLLGGATSAAQANLAGTLGAAGMLSNIGKTASGYRFDPYTGKPTS